MMRLALLALALVLIASKVEAQTTTGIRTCSVVATPLNFGTFSGSRVDSGGTVSVTCSGNGNNNILSIALSEGGSNTFLNRFMFNGLSELHYNLYTDGTHANIWGNGLGETQLKFESFDFRLIGSVTQAATIFGSIPAQAVPPPGHYSDQIIVTVIF
jgi:spore coat protein U-like protein